MAPPNAAGSSAPIKIVKPKLPKQLEPVILSDAGVDDESSFVQSACQDETLVYVTANKVQFDQMIFDNVTFQHVTLHHAELTDLVFNHCDLSNVDLSEAIMYRVQFNHCKILGLDLTAATIRNVVFDHCTGDYATFRFANMKQVSFQSTSLVKSDFIIPS